MNITSKLGRLLRQGHLSLRALPVRTMGQHGDHGKHGSDGYGDHGHDDHGHHHNRPALEVDRDQRTTLDNIPVPQGSWQQDYEAKQKKYNQWLLMSSATFLATFSFLVFSGFFNFNLGPCKKDIKGDFPGAKFAS